MEKLFEEMQKYRDEVRNKSNLEAILADKMRERFPNIVNIYFSEDSIDITTKKHTIRLSTWSKLKYVIPKFVCDGETKMPDTAEEFMEMKAFVEDDYKQCYTAFFWLFNRYDFGYNYGY